MAESDDALADVLTKLYARISAVNFLLVVSIISTSSKSELGRLEEQLESILKKGNLPSDDRFREALHESASRLLAALKQMKDDPDPEASDVR